MRIIFLILVFFSWKLSAQTSYVAPTMILGKKGHEFGLRGESFFSSKRVDQEGEKVDFEENESFRRYQGEFFGNLGITNNFQLGGGISFRQNISETQDDVKTSTGFESTFVNLIYAFPKVDKLNYALEGLFRFRSFSNEISTSSNDNIILGDDGQSYALGGVITYSSQTQNYLSARLGFRRPGRELSDEIYWQTEGVLSWRYLALVAGVNGVSSLRNSPYTDTPNERPNFNTGLTSLYNSINREFITPYLGVNIALGKFWRIELRGAQVVHAKSHDLGSMAGLSVVRRVDQTKTKTPDKKFKSYDFEGAVMKVSPKNGYVAIDKGIKDDLQIGMIVDFFDFDYAEGNVLLARGTVIKTKASSSIVKITRIYNKKRQLKEGDVARGSYR